MNNNHLKTEDAIRAEPEATRTVFHTLLASFSESDFRRQSRNPGGRFPRWTSKIFASTLYAFTTPFNWINAFGARLQARVFTHQRIGRVYDRVHNSLMRQLEGIKGEEWERGMHFPTQWDPNFHDFMTIRELFHYPIRHSTFTWDRSSDSKTWGMVE